MKLLVLLGLIGISWWDTLEKISTNLLGCVNHPVNWHDWRLHLNVHYSNILYRLHTANDTRIGIDISSINYNCNEQRSGKMQEHFPCYINFKTSHGPVYSLWTLTLRMSTEPRHVNWMYLTTRKYRQMLVSSTSAGGVKNSKISWFVKTWSYCFVDLFYME